MRLDEIFFIILVILMLIAMWFVLVIMSPESIVEVEILEIIEPEKPVRETVIIPQKVGGRCPRNFRYFCN